MAGGHRDKHKGAGWSDRPGLGRLRRANTKEAGRQGRWEDRVEDQTAVDLHGEIERASHAGESLLAKFNRLLRDADAGDGEAGEVSGFDGTRVLVRPDAGGPELACSVRRVLKKLVAGVKNPLCVGDRVRVDRSHDPVITALAPRRNQLERADSHNRALVQVFAANLDRLVVVASAGDPPLKPALIDRYLVIAAFNRIVPLVVVTKPDRGDPAPALALYRGLGLEVHAVRADRGADGEGVAGLRTALAGLTCVVAGQSGVGKSSLINALFPEAAARTGRVADEGHGRHTTNSARSWLLPGGGRLVDTPGIRECTITGLEPLDVALLYSDLARFHPGCHFRDCTHRHEPDCAVRAAVDRGDIAASRYASYLAIVEEDLAAT
jgi:ribosome biogenesis GTPase